MDADLKAGMYSDREQVPETRTAEELIEALSIARQTIDCLGLAVHAILLHSRSGSCIYKLATLGNLAVSAYFRRTRPIEGESIVSANGFGS